MLTLSFSTIAAHKNSALVLGIYEGADFLTSCKYFDKESLLYIKKALDLSKFKGGKGETFYLVAPQTLDASGIIFIGLGKKTLLSVNVLEEIGGTVMSVLLAQSYKKAVFFIQDLETKDFISAQIAAHLAQGSLLRSFQFDKYKTKEEDKSKSKELTFILSSSSDVKEAEKIFIPLKALAEGVFYARSLISEPANVINPETYAKELSSLEKDGLKVTVLGEKEMRQLGMNTLLGVGQGSEKESKLVILEWFGLTKDKKPLAFVGKGVTFDTGGICLKPAKGMEDMKWDMAGSAIVVGLLKELALRKAKVNAVGVIGLVENMPSGSAQRPGDVVTSMSGQTVEVLDTDAEGRLVLADALWYTQDKFHPEILIDLATLTGAIIIALGSEYAGLFSNNDTLAERLYETSLEVGEKLWRLPLHSAYDKDLTSDIADMRNIGGIREAGSSKAAQFLQRFVKDVPWAHLDIAGVTWSTKAAPLYEKGATGFGIRLLDRFISKYYEK